ncbi:MAG: energy-coupling factor transporter transmembrane component T [Planctomycetota bacterium]|nr:energy-coupling factor transporter transmembrane component T [Planctomycetota bacterium]
MVPLAKLVYLLVLAVGLFFLKDPRLVGALAVLQIVLWALSRVDFRLLGRIGRRLAILFVIIGLVYGLRETPGGGSDWQTVLGVKINLEGLRRALVFGLRILVLLLASTWVQKSGAPGDFARAMISARVPRSLALSIDATLSLLTVGGGGGGGGGGGKGQGKKDKRPITFAQLRSGDFGFLRDLLRRSIDRAQAKLVAEHPDLPERQAHDLALVTGISLAAMGLKMIQVMPGLPIAPGQKNLLLLPFFILASKTTKGRFGGLWCATTVGLLSFFLGYGKYGIFELAQFMVPGLLIDLLLPLIRGRAWWRLTQLCMLGALLGVTRFSANFLVLMLATSEWSEFWPLLVFYTPMLLSQIGFGTGSGFVSLFLLGLGGWLGDSGDAGGGGTGGVRGSRAGGEAGRSLGSEEDPGETNDDIKQAS